MKDQLTYCFGSAAHASSLFLSVVWCDLLLHLRTRQDTHLEEVERKVFVFCPDLLSMTTSKSAFGTFVGRKFKRCFPHQGFSDLFLSEANKQEPTVIKICAESKT